MKVLFFGDIVGRIGRQAVELILPELKKEFQQEVIDWQVWIDAGEVPVPRKVVITYPVAGTSSVPGHAIGVESLADTVGKDV